MKIYTVNGRKVWLDKAPKGYEEPKPKKAEIETENVEPIEPKAEPKPKARKVSNKARKAASNK